MQSHDSTCQCNLSTLSSDNSDSKASSKNISNKSKNVAIIGPAIAKINSRCVLRRRLKHATTYKNFTIPREKHPNTLHTMNIVACVDEERSIFRFSFRYGTDNRRLALCDIDFTQRHFSSNTSTNIQPSLSQLRKNRAC